MFYDQQNQVVTNYMSAEMLNIPSLNQHDQVFITLCVNKEKNIYSVKKRKIYKGCEKPGFVGPLVLENDRYNQVSTK